MWPEGLVNSAAGSNLNINEIGVSDGDCRDAEKLVTSSHFLTCENQMTEKSRSETTQPSQIEAWKKHSWWEPGARKFGFGEDQFCFRYTKIEVIQILLF